MTTRPNTTPNVYYGCETIQAGDGTEVHVHFANNKGRGADNVTLTRVPAGTTRPNYTRRYGSEVISQIRTSGWKGRIYLSRAVRNQLGI